MSAAAKLLRAKAYELLAQAEREEAAELEGGVAAPAAPESSTAPVAPERWNPNRVRARAKAQAIDDVSRQWAKKTCRAKGIPLRSESR